MMDSSLKQEQDKSKSANLPWWLGPETIDETITDLKTDDNASDNDEYDFVSFYFVGLRPTEDHKKLGRVCDISLNENTTVSAVKIEFDDLTLNNTVKALQNAIFKAFAISKARKSLLIHYGDTKLSNQFEKLRHYGITDGSIFVVAIYDNAAQNHNDQYLNKSQDEIERRFEVKRIAQTAERDMEIARQRLKRIQDLKDGIKPIATKTKSKKKPKFELKETLEKCKHIQTKKGFDVVMQEKDVVCMEMPLCGHILSRDSLYLYALSQYMDREQSIKCPHSMSDEKHSLCHRKWVYPLIKHCLSSTDIDGVSDQKTAEDVNSGDDAKGNTEEDNHNGRAVAATAAKSEIMCHKLALLSARNCIENSNYELQKCPDCHSLLYRNRADKNYECHTKCPMCPSKEFCWGCSTEWVEPWNDSHDCDSSNRAAFMQLLATCPRKKVGPAPDCPSVRACPKCHQLINHVSACKHMKCTLCKTDFCFICLKPKKNDNWCCGSYSDRCPTSKRQNFTLLPKLNQSSFSVF